jgi:hypothetical protein
MSDTLTQTRGTEVDPVALAAARKAATSAIRKAGRRIVDIADFCREAAAEVVKARQAIVRNGVPDWNGRTGAYREWYEQSITEKIATLVPEDYRESFAHNLQYHAQQLVKEIAPASDLQALNLSPLTQSQRQKAKATAAATPPTPADAESLDSLDNGDGRMVPGTSGAQPAVPTLGERAHGVTTMFTSLVRSYHIESEANTVDSAVREQVKSEVYELAGLVLEFQNELSGATEKVGRAAVS